MLVTYGSVSFGKQVRICAVHESMCDILEPQVAFEVVFEHSVNDCEATLKTRARSAKSVHYDR